MFNFALADQISDRARDLRDRHVGIDAVLIEEIDSIGLEPFQRRVGDRADVRRSAVQPRLLALFELESKLRRDDDPIADGRERFADELFVGERPVRFGRIEERDAAVDGCTNDCDTFVTTGRLSVAKADAHATEPERRHLQTVYSQCALLHDVSLPADATAFHSGLFEVSLRKPAFAANLGMLPAIC